MGIVKAKKHGIHWIFAFLLAEFVSVLCEVFIPEFVRLMQMGDGAVIATYPYLTAAQNIIWMTIWILLTGRRYGTKSGWIKTNIILFIIIRAITMALAIYRELDTTLSDAYYTYYGYEMPIFDIGFAVVLYLVVAIALLKLGQDMGERVAAKYAQTYKPLYPEQNATAEADAPKDINGFNPPERTDVPHYDQ